MANTTLLISALLASVAVACTALSAGLILRIPAVRLHAWLPWLQAMAAGLLLGDALLHMLPESIERGISVEWMGGCVALGALGLLGIECIVRTISPQSTTTTFAKMDIIGDLLHHLVDGIVIGASFVIDASLGTVVALAIMAHEIPRMAGNAGTLVAGGHAPVRAFGLSVATTAAIPMGALGMALVGHAPLVVGSSLALAAGTTIYLATGDLLPGLWQRLGPHNRFTPVLGAGAGVVFMWAASRLEHIP